MEIKHFILAWIAICIACGITIIGFLGWVIIKLLQHWSII